MSDLISRQALCEYALNQKDKSVTPNDIMRFPSAQPEITEDDVKEFCRKRCLIVVTSDFYDEMTRRLSSAEPDGKSMKPIDANALIAKLGIGHDCSVCEQNDTPYCRWNPNAVDVCEAISDAPTIEPDWTEMLVICDCCGHAIHVKRKEE